MRRKTREAKARAEAAKERYDDLSDVLHQLKVEAGLIPMPPEQLSQLPEVMQLPPGHRFRVEIEAWGEGHIKDACTRCGRDIRPNANHLCHGPQPPSKPRPPSRDPGELAGASLRAQYKHEAARWQEWADEVAEQVGELVCQMAG